MVDTQHDEVGSTDDRRVEQSNDGGEGRDPPHGSVIGSSTKTVYLRGFTAAWVGST